MDPQDYPEQIVEHTSKPVSRASARIQQSTRGTLRSRGPPRWCSAGPTAIRSFAPAAVSVGAPKRSDQTPGWGATEVVILMSGFERALPDAYRQIEKRTRDSHTHKGFAHRCTQAD